MDIYQQLTGADHHDRPLPLHPAGITRVSLGPYADQDMCGQTAMAAGESIACFTDAEQLTLVLAGSLSLGDRGNRPRLSGGSFLLRETGIGGCRAVELQGAADWLYLGFSSRCSMATNLNRDSDCLLRNPLPLPMPALMLRVASALYVQLTSGLASETELCTHRGILRFQARRQVCVHGGYLARIPVRSEKRRIDLYQRLLRARTYLRDEFAQDPTVEQTAAIAHLSRAHFLRLYRQAFGITPHQDLLAVKLACARKLLRNTDLDVNEVAVHCGFGNRSSFSRCFRQHVGHTPVDYKLAEPSAAAKSSTHPPRQSPVNPSATDKTRSLRLFAS